MTRRLVNCLVKIKIVICKYRIIKFGWKFKNILLKEYFYQTKINDELFWACWIRFDWQINRIADK